MSTIRDDGKESEGAITAPSSSLPSSTSSLVRAHDDEGPLRVVGYVSQYLIGIPVGIVATVAVAAVLFRGGLAIGMVPPAELIGLISFVVWLVTTVQTITGIRRLQEARWRRALGDEPGRRLPEQTGVGGPVTSTATSITTTTAPSKRPASDERR